jgi:copper(I)-binding protein
MSPARRPAVPLSMLGAVLCLSALTGCSAAAVDDAEPPIGTVARTQTITAMNMAAVTNGKGAAIVVGTVVNDGRVPDRLVDAHVTAESGPVTTTLPGGPVKLAPDKPVKLAAGKAILLTANGWREGLIVKLTLEFARSRDVHVGIPVEPQSGPYADIEVPHRR